MVTTSDFPSPVDGIAVATYTWGADLADPRAVVQIAHGLAEHGERYARLATALVDRGYVVVAQDHRGHGRTAEATMLGDFGDAGFAGLVSDVAALGSLLREQYPDLPLFLLGHSMGSFAAQEVILDHADQYAGVVLSGSTSLDVLAANLAQSPEPAGLEAFNAGFEHRTGYEWLSRDEAEVDAYVADPWCGFDLPEVTVPLLFSSAQRLADTAELAAIRPDLPVLLLSGTADPLAGGGALIDLLAQRYRDAGVEDVTAILYTDARHEVFNETNRDEVTADLLAWLDSHTS